MIAIALVALGLADAAAADVPRATLAEFESHAAGARVPVPSVDVEMPDGQVRSVTWDKSKRMSLRGSQWFDGEMVVHEACVAQVRKIPGVPNFFVELARCVPEDTGLGTSWVTIYLVDGEPVPDGYTAHAGHWRDERWVITESCSERSDFAALGPIAAGDVAAHQVDGVRLGLRCSYR